MAQWLVELHALVRATEANTVVGVIAALAACASYAGWRAQHALRRARTMEDIPTAKTRSAAQGYVELEGVGRLLEGPPIVAPLSGLRCVWYRYRIQEARGSVDRGDASDTAWTTVEQGVSNEIFCLEDDTGRVIVDPEGAEVTARQPEVWRGHGRNPPSPSGLPAAAMLLTHGGGGAYRYTEERIHEGEKIYALGLLKHAGSHLGAPDTREDIAELLRRWKQDQAGLKQRFDLNQDNQIDGREWQLARSQARREVLKTQHAEQQRFDESINVLRPTGDPSRPYLLSVYPQPRLIRRYRRGALGYGLLFLAAGAAALWLFNARFHG